MFRRSAPSQDSGQRRDRRFRWTRTKLTPRKRRGVVTVEFALVAPVFFIFLFAAFEFGRLFMLRHTADNAAYEAARKAMVPGATSAEAITEARRLLAMVGARSYTVTVDPPTLDENTESLTVTVQMPFADNAYLTPRLLGDTVLRSQVTLRTERYDPSR